MKKFRLDRSLPLFVSLIALMAGTLSCQKEGPKSYTNSVLYNGATYPIDSHSASEVKYMFANGLHMFYISFGEDYPQEFNYISFDIAHQLLNKKYTLAKESSSAKRWNISLSDIEEDLYIYGSSERMRDIVGGTLYVKSRANNHFEIELTFSTADRKDLTVSYKGVVSEMILSPEERAKIEQNLLTIELWI
ncbi:MAG: hypothetical protein WC960_07430 [Bacteroidales bacterium]